MPKLASQEELDELKAAVKLAHRDMERARALFVNKKMDYAEALEICEKFRLAYITFGKARFQKSYIPAPGKHQLLRSGAPMYGG